jgi:two-component system chemotaxis response regulator CheB
MRKVRVLVVDDSLTIRAMLERVLAHDPEICVIGSAADADEAWEQMIRDNPDVVTLDITMPGLDGLRFLSDIMARKPTPVVMVSGTTAPGCQEREEALRRGAAACFGKDRILSGSAILVDLVKKAARSRGILGWKPARGSAGGA